jgi:MATE family multidrug resistance protein
LALPLVFAQLAAVGMNVIDTLLAGHLGAGILAAIAVGASVWVLAIVIALGVMMAVPPSVAHLVGGGRRAEIGPLFRQGVWLALGLGAVLGVATFRLGPLLPPAMGVAPELLPEVTAFLRAIAFGAPALTLYFAVRGFSEGLGLTRPSMYFGLLGLAVLAPLGYVLMYGRLGLPALGARGCGIANAAALWVDALGILIYVLLRRHYRDLDLGARLERPDPRAIGELLRIGVPMGVSVFMEASLFIAAALVLGRLGADVVASHQVAINVASVAFMVPMGIAMAMTVRIGQAAGRGDGIGVRAAARAGFTLVLASQTLSALAMLLLPGPIAGLYTRDASVLALATRLLILAGVFQFSDGVQVAANGALRGLKDTRVPMLITTFAYWGVGMVSGLWLAFGRGLGARGMWFGLIAGLSTAALLLSLRFARLARRA